MRKIFIDFVPFCKIEKLNYSRRRQILKSMVWLTRKA